MVGDGLMYPSYISHFSFQMIVVSHWRITEANHMFKSLQACPHIPVEGGHWKF